MIIISPSVTAWKVPKYGVFSGPYFPTFGLNTERYEVSLRIQSKCGKIQTRRNFAFGHFSRSVSLNNNIVGQYVILGWYFVTFYQTLCESIYYCTRCHHESIVFGKVTGHYGYVEILDSLMILLLFSFGIIVSSVSIFLHFLLNLTLEHFSLH